MRIGDGAMATALQSRGLPVGTAPESWTLSHSEAVAGIAEDYAQAGSDFVLTNTFGANRFRLERAGLAPEVDELNRAAVDLARAGVGRKPDGKVRAVYGSVGPTGLGLDEMDARRSEVMRAFEEQVGALAHAEVDAFVVETSVSTREALIALAACRATNVDTIVSFTFRIEEGVVKTLAGESLADGGRQIRDAGANAVGLNCVAARDIERVIRGFPADIPIWLKPNAGCPEVHDDRMIYPDTDEEIVEVLTRLAKSGVRYVGGCCGTGPSFITRLKGAMGDP